MIFVHIHKAGGSSFEVALDPFLGWNDLLVGSTPFGELVSDHYGKRYGLHKHSSIAEIEAICGTGIVDSYFTCALVRHPVARIVSLFNFIGSIVYAIADSHHMTLADLNDESVNLENQHPELKWASSKAFLAATEFGDFVRNPILSHDSAFACQVDRITRQNGQTVSHIWKLEEIDAWLPLLRQHMNSTTLDFPQVNPSARKLVTSADLDKNDRNFLQTQFQRDLTGLRY